MIRTSDQQRTVGRLQFGGDVGKQLAPRPGLTDHVLVAELDLWCVRVRGCTLAMGRMGWVGRMVGWLNGWTNGMDGWMDGWMNEMDGWMDEWDGMEWMGRRTIRNRARA